MNDATHDTYELPEGFRHSPKLQPVRNAAGPLERVQAIVRVLHGPGGCPWDGEQTNRSLVKPLLEETYEYIEAVETGDRDNMREELGDMLLQSIFQAQVCSEDPDDPFTLAEVCDRLVDKLITRHPHLFADDAAAGELTGEETLALWERVKQQEKQRDSVLDGISRAQGALPPRREGRLAHPQGGRCGGARRRVHAARTGRRCRADRGRDACVRARGGRCGRRRGERAAQPAAAGRAAGHGTRGTGTGVAAAVQRHETAGQRGVAARSPLL